MHADFAGMWGYEDEQDPSCVKSRTGFVIFIQGCPVVWKSKLQTDVATSTMESEYNDLSTSMRDVLPLKELTKDSDITRSRRNWLDRIQSNDSKERPKNYDLQYYVA
jgi:hypothetical protein